MTVLACVVGVVAWSAFSAPALGQASCLGTLVTPGGEGVDVGGDVAVASSSGAFHVLHLKNGFWVDQHAVTGLGSSKLAPTAVIDGQTIVTDATEGPRVYSTDGTFIKALIGSDTAPLDEFGNTFDISGDTILVGSFLHDPVVGGKTYANAGAVYVFRRNQGGPDNWGQAAKLVAPVPSVGARFGGEVTLSAGRAAIADLDFLHVFDHADGLDWTLDATTDIPVPIDQFSAGSALALSGDRLVAGAAVYERDAGGRGDWGLVATLEPPDDDDLLNFGSSVAMDGDVIVVAGDGFSGETFPRASVFQRDAGGPDNWGRVLDLEHPFEFGYSFATSVAVGSGHALVAMPFQSEIIDCCEAHGTPGCNLSSCEGAVCAASPACCSGPWTSTCAFLAQALCGTPSGSYCPQTAAIAFAYEFAECVPCRSIADPAGEVGIGDLIALLSAWGQTGVPADFVEPPSVGIEDLLALLSLWGPCL